MKSNFNWLNSKFSAVRTLIIAVLVGATTVNAQTSYKSYLKPSDSRALEEWKTQFKNGELSFVGPEIDMDFYSKTISNQIQKITGEKKDNGSSDQDYVVSKFDDFSERTIDGGSMLKIGGLTSDGKHTTFLRKPYPGEKFICINKNGNTVPVLSLRCGQEAEFSKDVLTSSSKKDTTTSLPLTSTAPIGTTGDLNNTPPPPTVKPGDPSTYSNTSTNSVTYTSTNSTNAVISQPDIVGYAKWQALGAIGSSVLNVGGQILTALIFRDAYGRNQYYYPQGNNLIPIVPQGNGFVFGNNTQTTYNPMGVNPINAVFGNGYNPMGTNNTIAPVFGNSYNPSGANIGGITGNGFSNGTGIVPVGGSGAGVNVQNGIITGWGFH